MFMKMKTNDIIQHIEDLENLLIDVLPDTDKIHKDEILDICSLVRMRTEQYIN